MKVFSFVTQTFTIFAFLTLGSLLIIFGVHILAIDDALFRIREIYDSPIKSVQTIFLGMLFISIGLAFTKKLVKKNHTDAIIFQSEIGPIVISVHALEDVTRKVLKRFHLVKEWKLQTKLQHKDINIQMRLILWSGGRVQELLSEIQEEVRARLRKLVGTESRIEIGCDVFRIEDHEVDLEQQPIEQRMRAAI